MICANFYITLRAIFNILTNFADLAKYTQSNMKKILIPFLAIISCACAVADTIPVNIFRHVGPLPVMQPVQLDSTDVNAKKYDAKTLLETRVSLDVVRRGEEWSGDELPGNGEKVLHLLGFAVNTSSYFKGELKLVKAPKEYQLFVDGNKSQAGQQTFEPGSHEVVIKYLSQDDAVDSISVCLVADSAAKVQASAVKVRDIAATDGRLLDIRQLVSAGRYTSVSVSADGKWITTVSYKTPKTKGAEWEYLLWNRSRNTATRLYRTVTWLPRSSRYYYTENSQNGRRIVVVDPATGKSEIMAEDIPDGSFTVLPTEDRLLYTLRQEGPKELNQDAFEFVHPDDRQPGWRDRSTLALYDIRTGLMQPLTFGYNSHWLNDLSWDGTKMLFSKSEADLTGRPTLLTSIYQMDLQTLKVDTLVVRDGFISGASFSPDGRSIVISGSPEALGGIGNTVPEGMTPNMYDYQMYVMDIESRDIRPLTKDFLGTVTRLDWSPSDNRIYFMAEVGDKCQLYYVNTTNWSINAIAQPEEVVDNFAMSNGSKVMALAGESNNHSWRLYSLEEGKGGYRTTLMQDLNADVYAGTDVDECQAWTFTNSNGDEVLCRYYMPEGFEEGEKYPMIVYYYGGCSGTLRNFEYTYPWNIWADNGYAVLVVNPSGATGFGQEWAARHVNTAGVDPARDIIEATQTFCDEHEWVDADRLGCIGASYGGFMTQYLQTVTDIFRCAVSHAGISDHTTYWGYGYWGYTYSEVSMAHSYPWNRKDLYVERSPIYNADKIKSSMLFLHGTDDTNVPYNNSLQMFTALKLLGKDVAMVSIKGENHGIRDPKKRIAWHIATMAWFARCLKDDPTWWEALYPKKTL